MLLCTITSWFLMASRGNVDGSKAAGVHEYEAVGELMQKVVLNSGTKVVFCCKRHQLYGRAHYGSLYQLHSVNTDIYVMDYYLIELLLVVCKREIIGASRTAIKIVYTVWWVSIMTCMWI